MNLPPFIAPILLSIEKHLELLFPKEGGGLLEKAARYTLFAPSKRLRPLFLLTLLKDFAIPHEQGLNAAIALECIHTYSLIHDDLPCIDNDKMRRGKPALHIVYGEANALLTGNFLLTRAFECASKAHLSHPSLNLEVVNILAKRAGSEGMLGGQVLDLLSEKKRLAPKVLEEMHRKKTAALFAAACESAAVIAALDQEERKRLATCGECFGIAFQIGDDISDKKSAISSDLVKEKATFASHYTLEKALELEEMFFQSALKALKAVSLKTPHFEQLLTNIREQKHNLFAH